MNKLLTSLIEFLEAKSLSYDPDEEAQAVRLGVERANLRWRCIACEDDSGRFVFVSLIPIKAPEARRVERAPNCSAASMAPQPWQFRSGFQRRRAGLPHGGAGSEKRPAFRRPDRAHPPRPQCRRRSVHPGDHLRGLLRHWGGHDAASVQTELLSGRGALRGSFKEGERLLGRNVAHIFLATACRIGPS